MNKEVEKVEDGAEKIKTVFKSSGKMSDDPKYEYGSVNINGVDLPNSVLCANCGYPLGEHMPFRNQGCPTKEIVARNAKREAILRCIMNPIIRQSISLN